MIDPITAATVGSALVATTSEMSESLRRSSYSPIIREMLDYSCGVFTPRGEMAAQSETIPALLGAMAFALQALIEDHPRQTLAPGDIFIANDPYRGGTHTPDIHLFAPVFHEDRLVAWTGTLAHHVDIGGTNPGPDDRPVHGQARIEQPVQVPGLVRPVKVAQPDMHDTGCQGGPVISRHPHARRQRGQCRVGQRDQLIHWPPSTL